jgi:hypothetical protein
MNSKAVSGQRNPVALALGAFLISFGAMFAYWWVEVRKFWAPDGDEFALITNSARMFHPHPLEWFTQGYRDYLTVYPELTMPRSNFLRPVANLKYYLESIVFGTHWSSYLVTNYLFLALLTALTVYIGARYLKLSKWLLILLGVLTFLTPGQDFYAQFYPNSCLDMIAATFVAAALILLFEFQLPAALITLVAAILTKETAHFAPFAASLYLLLFAVRPLTTKIKVYIALFPVPVVALYLWRSIVFSRSVGGVYILEGSSRFGLIKRVGIGFMQWPFHLYMYDTFGFDYSTWSHRLIRHILMVVCVVFWVVLCRQLWDLVRQVRERRETGNLPISPARAAATILIFLAGALVLPAAFNLTARFGAIAFPLLILFGLYTIATSTSKWLSRLWILFLAVLCLSSIQDRLYLFGRTSWMQMNWHISTSYVDTAAHSPAGVLFIVDDTTGHDASGKWLRIFSGHHGPIVRINSIVYNVVPQQCQQASSVLTRQSESSFTVAFHSVTCGAAILPAINILPPAQWHTTVDGEELNYDFDWKHQLVSVTVHAAPGHPFSIMQFDPATTEYRMVDTSSMH